MVAVSVEFHSTLGVELVVAEERVSVAVSAAGTSRFIALAFVPILVGIIVMLAIEVASPSTLDESQSGSQQRSQGRACLLYTSRCV